MNKALEIVHLVTKIGNLAKLNITFGLSEHLSSPCVFALKDREFFNKLAAQMPLIQEMQRRGTFEAYIPEQKVVGLLARLGEIMGSTIIMSVDEDLKEDCVILFRDVDLIDSIFKEGKKEREGFAWSTT